MNTTVSTLLATLTPHLLEILGAVLTLLIARVAATLRRRWGLDIDARHREALHSALMSGARIAIDRGLSGARATELALLYTRDSVPAALKHLKPEDAVLEQLARAKLQSVTAA